MKKKSEKNRPTLFVGRPRLLFLSSFFNDAPESGFFSFFFVKPSCTDKNTHTHTHTHTHTEREPMGFHFGAPFPSDQRTVPDRCDPIFRGGYSFVLVRFCFSALAPTRRRVPRRRCQIDGKFRPLRRPTQVHRSSAIGRPWDDDRKKTGSKRFIFLFFWKKEEPTLDTRFHERDSRTDTPLQRDALGRARKKKKKKEPLRSGTK